MTPEALGRALETRHLETLTFPEVRRALQALSTLYVQKRGKLGRGAVFDGAGKRAAFALFYGPLHYALTRDLLRELEPQSPPTENVLDLGCGTGVVGAAWAVHAGAESITGVDVEDWTLREAAWTYRALSLSGRTKRGDAARTSLVGYDAIAAGYLVNELPDSGRAKLLHRLLDSGRQGARVLVLEPIAKKLVPWWSEWARAFEEAGGRADEWRFTSERPEIVAKLDKAAKLDHREQKARTLYLAAPR